MVVAENEVGPAYNSEGSTDLAQVKNDLDTFSNKIEAIDNLLKEKEWVEKHEFVSRKQYVEQRLEGLEEKVDNAREIAYSCDETSKTIKYAMIDVNNQLEKVSL